MKLCRFTTTVAATLCAVAFTCGAALAQPGRPEGPPPPPGNGPDRGMPGADLEQFLQKQGKELGVTEAQEQQIRQLVEQF